MTFLWDVLTEVKMLRVYRVRKCDDRGKKEEGKKKKKSITFCMDRNQTLEVGRETDKQADR